MDLIERSLRKGVLQALGDCPIVYVNGPRQAGKSTLALELAANEWPADYVTFDQATMLGAAEANPESFLRAYEGPLILDEIQMVPGLFRALKLLVDEARHESDHAAGGHYLLTGSANVMSLPELSDALVGRMRVLTLYPLSALEIAGGKGDFLTCLFENGFKPGTYRTEVVPADMIQRATFPEIWDKEEATRRHWFESYIATLLQRDVRQMASIAKLGVLPNLLKVLASRPGGLVNEADIARSIGQNAVTTKSYRVLLQMIFLTMDVKPWFRNIGKRLVKSPKNYIMDTSLLCHLLQIDLQRCQITDPHMFGHIFENFVATELAKQLAVSDGIADLHHFRTSDGKEVDFVLERSDGKLAGIEAKGRDAVSDDDFRGLKELRRQVDDDLVCGIVLYRGNSIVSFDERMWAVPVSAMWG